MTQNPESNADDVSEDGQNMNDLISDLQSLDDSGEIIERKEAKMVSERVSTTPPPPPDQSSLRREGAAKVRRTGGKYHELRKRPSMEALKNDDMQTLEELSDVVAPVSKAIKLIEDFERKYKGFCNEQRMASFRMQLRETSAVMLSEFYSLRNGKQNKTYDESKICKICHSVFMVKLPEDRTCDACRSQIRED